MFFLVSANQTTLQPHTCEVPYTEVVVANVLIAVISFWIPILIIFVLYFMIYRKCSELRRRNREKKIFLSTYLIQNMNLAYGLEESNMNNSSSGRSVMSPPDSTRQLRRQNASESVLGRGSLQVKLTFYV